MALSNTTTASYSNILHPNKDTQTDPSRETYYSFVDKLLQPMAQQQKSYLKDTTHFINFLEKTKVPENTILVSMDVMSLCRNIPQEELRINIKKRTSYPYTTTAKSAQTYPSGELLPVYWKNYVQIHGTATGTKMAVAFANIFMAKVTREEITQFIEQANKQHQTIKSTAKVFKTETNFLDTTVYKGEGFRNESVLDVRTHFKPTETFQCTHFSTCHPPGVKRGFIKGEALRLLRTNSSKTFFEESVTNFKTHLLETERMPRKLYSNNPLRSYFWRQESSPPTKTKTKKENLALCNAITPAVPNLKPILVNSWHFITQQPLLNDIFKEPPLKDILVRAKL